MKENMELQEKQQARKVSTRRLMSRLCVFVMIVAMFSVSAFAAEGGGGAATVLESAGTITTLINQVFSLITGNWYLTLFLCLGLLGLGISAFKRMKRAAR